MITMHPGEYLRRLYLSDGTSYRRFAAKADLSKTAVGLIVSGHKRVTAKIALKLERATGRSAESWMLMQTDYDLSVERTVNGFVKAAEAENGRD